MQRPFQVFSTDDKGVLKRAFENVNPTYWAAAQGNVDSFENLKDIVDDANELRVEIKASQVEHRHDRIQQEYKRIREERAIGLDDVSPDVRTHLQSHDVILQEARKLVRLQEERELIAVDKFVDDAAQTIQAADNNQPNPHSKTENDNMSDQENQSHLKAEVHDLVNKTVEARMQAGRMMSSERQRLLDEARSSGSQSPEEDVKSFQRALYRDIDEKLHRDIHATFSRYGYDADHQQVQFIANGGDVTVENSDSLEPNQSSEINEVKSDHSDGHDQ
jgi:hypothetical protein